MLENIVEKIIPHFMNDSGPINNLSKNGLFHFRTKLPYLNNARKIERTWKGVRYHLNKWDINISKARILDLGCGVGYTSIYFAAAGAGKVVGLDLRDSKIEAFKAYVSKLPKNIRDRIDIIKSDIQNVEYTDQFDLIYAQEAISHIVDDHLLERLYGMLSPGGLLYIKDGNNELCRGYKQKLFKYWDRIEHGPKGKCAPHNIEFIYRELREQLIADWYGDKFNQEEIRMLSENTAYLFGDNLKGVCEEYLKTGIKPDSKYRYATPPIHPEYGYFIEKLFNPYHLQRELVKTGFQKCKLYGPSGYSRGELTRFTFNLLPLRLKYYLCPSFVVIAKK